jgi:Arc/MetJ-type ribon-helix-helix transcriptional regulator
LDNLSEERTGKSQITVRLDPENVEFLDELVAEGPSTSRADALNRILRRERRRYRVMKDDQRLRDEGETSHLSGIETVAQRIPLAD